MTERHLEIDIEEVAKGFNLEKGQLDSLSQLDDAGTIALIAHLADVKGFTDRDFKKVGLPNLPSFSAAKWSDLGPQLGLPANAELLMLADFVTPKFCLPSSFHQATFENAWRWQDVYREWSDQATEAPKMRIFEPYIVPIIALFQGRVIDLPEQRMGPNRYSCGGKVEHQIFVIGGALLLIIEGKTFTKDPNDMAQLFSELLSAAQMNKENNFADLRIYGLLTNLSTFRFYSYDPIKDQFFFDEIIKVNVKRIDGLLDMVEVSNKIFGIVLSGYIDFLHATVKARSAGTGSKYSIYMNRSISTGQWEDALNFAKMCRGKFEEPATSVQDIEINGHAALSLLKDSVRSIPRFSGFSGGKEDPSTPDDLKALATRVVKQAQEAFLPAK
ncbi:hypothetical protein FPV67DRAFT_739572 [Lyophyllum atratum]|nr:hypothetical protein FPV67DRAFT_739572 [Lyophyllum atratum]